jgi:tetratricopeptide (TPR) repeat protein
MWFLLLALLAQSSNYLAEGNQALDAKQYDRAIELFTKAVAADPKDYGAEFQLALTYSLLGKDPDAIPHYRAALVLRPGLYEAELNLGLSLLRTKDAAAAIPYLKGALDQKPQEFRPAFYFAQALLDTQQYPAAEAAFRNAAALDTRSGAAQSGWAEALLRQGRADDAKPHVDDAFTLDRTFRHQYVELAELYESKHRNAEAIAMYREFPDDPIAQEHLGVLLTAEGNLAEAIPSLEMAVAKSPTEANRVALAQAYAKNKQLDKAQAVAAEAVEASPRDPDLRLFYARFLRDQRKFPEAAAQFAAVAQIKPDSIEAWSELASVLVITGQYPQGIAALDRVRALGAESSGHLFFRALALDHMDRRAEAIDDYTKFLAGSQGKFPDQEFQARQRVRILEAELKKR